MILVHSAQVLNRRTLKQDKFGKKEYDLQFKLRHYNILKSKSLAKEKTQYIKYTG